MELLERDEALEALYAARDAAARGEGRAVFGSLDTDDGTDAASSRATGRLPIFGGAST